MCLQHRSTERHHSCPSLLNTFRKGFNTFPTTFLRICITHILIHLWQHQQRQDRTTLSALNQQYTQPFITKNAPRFSLQVHYNFSKCTSCHRITCTITNAKHMATLTIKLKKKSHPNSISQATVLQFSHTLKCKIFKTYTKSSRRVQNIACSHGHNYYSLNFKHIPHHILMYFAISTRAQNIALPRV